MMMVYVCLAYGYVSRSTKMRAAAPTTLNELEGRVEFTFLTRHTLGSLVCHALCRDRVTSTRPKRPLFLVPFNPIAFFRKVGE